MTEPAAVPVATPAAQPVAAPVVAPAVPPAAPAVAPAPAAEPAPAATEVQALKAQAQQAQASLGELERWKAGVMRALGGDTGAAAPDPATVLRQAEVALQRAHVASLASEFNVRRPMDLAKVLDGPEFAVDIQTAGLRNPAGARAAVATYLAANDFWRHKDPPAPAVGAPVIPAQLAIPPAAGAVPPAGSAERPADPATLNGRTGVRLFTDFASVIPSQQRT